MGTESETVYELIRSLNLREDDKVLFMYCGAGDLSGYIANIVKNGKVVAVDPKQEDIEYCRKKYADVDNLAFHVSDTLIMDGFPDQREEYYDVVFSKNAFSCFKTKSKDEYLEKAYKCLKPGGRLSILAESNLKEVDLAAILPKDRTNEYLTGMATEITSNVAYFTEFDEFFSSLRSSNLEMNAEIEDWLDGYKKKCEAREIDGALNLEFRQSVRTHTTKNDV